MFFSDYQFEKNTSSNTIAGVKYLYNNLYRVVTAPTQLGYTPVEPKTKLGETPVKPKPFRSSQAEKWKYRISGLVKQNNLQTD